jgi:murein DD-endopeptidase MepM/ murein hydrolase activator NlpD
MGLRVHPAMAVLVLLVVLGVVSSCAEFPVTEVSGLLTERIIVTTLDEVIKGDGRTPEARPTNESKYKFPVEVCLTRDMVDTWGAARDYRAGAHAGVDIYVPEGTEVFAVVGGTVVALPSNPEVGGNMLFMRDKDGNTWGYVHLKGYAKWIMKGAIVGRGALLGYSGKTGIKRSPPHLHVQVKGPDQALWNPYKLLKEAHDQQKVSGCE